MANKHTIQFNGHARLIGTANHEIKQLPPSIISRQSLDLWCLDMPIALLLLFKLVML